MKKNLKKSTQIFEIYEKKKGKIFFNFWIFNEEREKQQKDSKHENSESKHMMHARTLWMSRWTPRTYFWKFLRKDTHARHQT